MALASEREKEIDSLDGHPIEILKVQGPRLGVEPLLHP